MLARRINRRRENFQIRAINDLEGTCAIYLYALAVIVVVVGVREIYTNVEKENTKNQRSCVGFSDFRKKNDGGNDISFFTLAFNIFKKMNMKTSFKSSRKNHQFQAPTTVM